MQKMAIFTLGIFVVFPFCSVMALNTQKVEKEPFNQTARYFSEQTGNVTKKKGINRQIFTDGTIHEAKEIIVNDICVKQGVQKTYNSKVASFAKNVESILLLGQKIRDLALLYQKDPNSTELHPGFKAFLDFESEREKAYQACSTDKNAIKELDKKVLKEGFIFFKKFDTSVDEIIQLSRLGFACTSLTGEFSDARYLEHLATLPTCRDFKFGTEQNSVLHIVAFADPELLERVAQILGLSLDIKNKNGITPRELRDLNKELEDLLTIKYSDITNDPFFKEDKKS